MEPVSCYLYKRKCLDTYEQGEACVVIGLSPVMQQFGGHEEGAGADTGPEGQLLQQPCGHGQEGLGLLRGEGEVLVSRVNGNLVISWRY